MRFRLIFEIETLSYTLKVLNFAIFAIFDHFCEILYPRKVSKPQNREIKYPLNLDKCRV